MKRKKYVRFLSLVLTSALVGQTMLIPVWAEGENGEQVSAHNEQMPDPIFEMDFESLTEETGTEVTDSFAAGEQMVTVHDKVTVKEGYNGGKAVLLDNTSGNTGYLTVPNTDELNPQDITVSVWLKRTSGTNKEGRVLWNKEMKETDRDAWKSDGWFLGWTSGEAMALVTDGANMAVQKGNSEELLPKDKWTNITATFDSATGEHIIYKDGAAFVSNTVSGASITKNMDAAELLIGKSGYGDAGIGCVLDDIRIFDQALSEQQVGEIAGLGDTDYAKQDAESINIPQRVTEDFLLPLEGKSGSSISWESFDEAIKIDEGGTAAVTRGEEDNLVKLTATVTYGTATETKDFEVTVVKANQPVEGLKKLSSDEILNVGGTIGARLEDAANVYGMDFLYKQRMQISLDEYKNHSHSHWRWLEGEQPGKWLEAMANYKWLDKDGEIKAAITDVVEQLAATQTVEDKSATGYNQFAGYLGNSTASLRNSSPVKGMDPYEMYSTLNGLINVYEKYRGDDTALADKALDCAVKLADYLVATIGDEHTKVCYQDGTESNMNKKEFWPIVPNYGTDNGATVAGHAVHQGWEGTLLIDPIMKLAGIVEDGSKSGAYSQWTDWTISNIDKWASSYNGYGDTPYADLDKVASGEMGIDEIQHYVHAHTFQMNFLGFLKKYQETGDSTYLDKVVGAWKDITGRQMYITGTVSVGEHYEAGHNLPNTGSVGETCATNSWTLLNNNLFELTQDAQYQQIVENVLFNHMFATSTIDGDGYSYHRALNGKTELFYTGFNSAGVDGVNFPDCCSSSGMRMQSYIPYYIYSKSDSEVYVNQFIESEANIELGNGEIMHLKQSTNYPEDDSIQLEIMEGSTANTVKVRIPDWVENPTIQVNGETVTAATAGEYAVLNVAAGDIVDITYPSKLTWVQGDNSNDGLWAMKKGPMVYCMDSAFMSKEESQAAFGSDVAKVTNSGVINPEKGRAVEAAEEINYDDPRIFGNGYKVKMYTPLGEQNVTVVPFANAGQWYRYGEEAPGAFGKNYKASTEYPYAIWMSADMTEYPDMPEEETRPVVHYDFDSVEGTTVKDISGNGHDAVLKGGAAVSEKGKLGSAVTLNGTNSYIQMPEDIIYGLYNMTITSWVSPDELGSWVRLFDFGNPGTDPPYPNLFLTLNGNNNTRLAYEEGTGESDKSHVNTSVLKTGVWQHIAVTIDGSKAALYINGVKAAENSGFLFTPVMTSKMQSNMIGKSNYSADKLYKGSIDDFRIYNRALGTDELTALAAGEEPVRKIASIVQPDPVETTVGTAPELPGKVNVTYQNGTIGREAVNWENVPEASYGKPGTFEVKGTVGEYEVTITVVVKGNGGEISVESITVIPPAKTEYGQGEPLDLKGLIVNAHLSDGSQIEIQEGPEGYSVNGYEPNKTGSQTITVSYQDKKASFQVTVIANVQAGWEQSGNRWKYRNADGSYVSNAWKLVDGKWYYFNKDEYMVTGWLLDGKTWYYLKDNGAMATGWVQLGNTWYYLKSSGAMATGWVQLGNTWYYLKSSGAMATGWLLDGRTWYYLKSSGAMATGWLLDGKTWYYLKNSGAMATGWLLDGKTWYYLKSSGAMATGWLLDGRTWYYLKSSGAMATGWLLDGKTWYYLKSNGAMATGWVKVSGKWYYLRTNGAMASKTWIGKYYVNASGVWTKTR
ncbi:LamG-like jellyroll fold domain-containing protein [Lactonifactor longoviformis]|uniref:Glucan-binding domain-containing protein (YG repeat) n=2 Tax=Lactonifactor TaxID=420345 RepID=A0A1M5BDU1_9CLOT|nr:LamG-like jellyroll fold domain-containing protein [Lactonifactor longoviformis]SHF40332.1 Glucan-binding domain-containing protein (YG repeat) [Lactonifactor longoviformis DSM 17459]